ncbi:MAG: FecR domain-containing protein, partial [Nitrospirae bacterium]|nr:FecR domain-containing protein [Nitrospirota bacterium]
MKKSIITIILCLLFSFIAAGLAIGADQNTDMLKVFQKEISPLEPLLPPDVSIEKGFKPGTTEQIGVINIVEGTGYIIHEGSNSAYTVKTDIVLCMGDTLVTQKNSRIGIILDDKSSINLTSHSKLVLTRISYDSEKNKRDSVVHLLYGKARFVVSKISGQNTTNYTVKTPICVAGVRGSDFVIAVGPVEDFTEASLMNRFFAWFNLITEVSANVSASSLGSTIVTGDETTVAFSGLTGGSKEIGPLSASRALRGLAAVAPVRLGNAAKAAMNSVGTPIQPKPRDKIKKDKSDKDKTDTKTDSNPDAKTDVKPDVKPDAKTDVKPDAKTDKSDTKTNKDNTLAANQTYTIVASAGTGGSISPSGNSVVNSGGSQSYSITTNTGYKISSVTVDGGSVGSVSSYTFSNVAANHNISVTFDSISYSITASAGTGGSVSPSGTSSVTSGGSQTYTITPNTGYKINDVSVDGGSVGVVSTYTFSGVTATHTISASFSSSTYTITASGGAGGSLSPSGLSSVTSGGSQTYVITPNTGYKITDVSVDGGSVGAVTSYTFSSVTSTHTISASFEQNTYTITAFSGTGGNVSPSGMSTITSGWSQTYTITPNTGYKIIDVTVDGGSVGAVSSYTFSAVTGNHTISATFDANTYIVTASAGTGGSISPSGASSVISGNSQTYVITPASGYLINDV